MKQPNIQRRNFTAAAAAAAAASAFAPFGILRAQSGVLRIAVLNDMSSVYAEDAPDVPLRSEEAAGRGRLL